MFLSTFEGLRKRIIENKSIRSLLHLSRGVFGADFGASSAVIQNDADSLAKGTYFRLVERTFQEFEQSHLCMLLSRRWLTMTSSTASKTILKMLLGYLIPKMD